MATITVDPNTSLQTVRSWAAGNEVGASDCPVTVENYRDELLDTAVDSGLNGIHMTIQISEVENTTDYFQAWMDIGQDAPHAARDAWITSNGAPVNDDADPDNYNASGFKWGRITDTMTRIVLPMRTKLAARGETLFLSFVPGHTSLSNQYFVDDPDEYGEWILAVWNRFNSTYGFVPDALEILGEPDHGDRQITPAELVAMMASARTRLLAAGYSEPIWMAPGTVSGPAARQYYLDMKTADAATAAHLDVLTYHRYVNIDDTALGNLWTTASTDGKIGTGMTEFDGGYDLIDLWSDLKVGHGVIGSAMAVGYPSSTDTGHLFYPTGNGSAGDLPINKVHRVKYMEHIWRYVRGNAVRKGVSIGGTGASNVDALPFRNANGTWAVVAKCSAAVDLVVSGLPNGTYKVKYTTGNFTTAPSAYDQSLSDQVVTTGSTGTISMPAAGIITIYDQNYLTNTGYQLYVSKNAGPYQFIGTEVKPYNSTNLTDGAATTSRLTGGTGSFIAGEVSEDGGVDDYTITTNDYSEVLFSLELESSLLANADTLDFRVYYNGQLLGAYDHTPRLTITQLVHHTLTAETGAFNYAGAAANLLRSLGLGAETGTFSYAGADAGLQRDITLAAENGDFIYDGADANLLKGWRLAAETGPFTYTGQDANLLRGLRLLAETGTFNYAGADANLIYSPAGNYSLTADAGSFSYSGQVANLLKGWRLNAETGTFSYAGQDANLLKGWRLNAETGAFTYTGQDANLLRGLRLLAETGTFNYAGNDAALIYSPVGSFTLAANTGVFTYTGHPANLLRALRIIAETGTFSYAGQTANLVKGYRLLAETGTFNYAGADAAFQWVRRLIAEGAIFSYSGGQVVLTHAGFVIPLPAPLTMILDLDERSMALDLNELSVMLED